MTSNEKARQKIAFAEMDAQIRKKINASLAERSKQAEQATQPSAAALPVACKPGSGGGCAVMSDKRRKNVTSRRKR